MADDDVMVENDAEVDKIIDEVVKANKQENVIRNSSYSRILKFLFVRLE